MISVNDLCRGLKHHSRQRVSGLQGPPASCQGVVGKVIPEAVIDGAL